MFLPGTPCGCCGSAPCQPCPRCAPICLTATFSGFSHATETCDECSYIDDVTFQLKRPPDPTLSVTASVPSATGSGATFSVTTARSTADGSYSVTGIKLTNGGVNYSIGDKVAFSSNGCIVEPPEATITIATTPPQSKMNLPGVGNTDFLYAGSGGTVVPVTYQQQTAEDGNPYWSVASMGQPFAGAGYSLMQVVNLSPEAGVVVVEPATARITEVNRAIPALGVRIHRAGGGTFDGGLVVGRAQGVDANGRLVWSASSVGIGWWFPSDFTAADTVSFYTSGTTATTVRAAAATIAVDENGAITSFTITDGGEYYDTNGVPLAAELLTAGKYYKPGVITSVTLVSGGKIFGQNACDYVSDRICAVCPVGDAFGDLINLRQLFVTLSLSGASHSLTLWLRDWYDFGGGPRFNDTAIVTASKSSVDDQGKPISCDGFVFDGNGVQGCSTNGTITLAASECGTTESYCDTEGNMPDQITLSLTGMGKLFSWSSRNGGAPGSPPTPMSEECGIQYDILVRGTGTASGPSGYAGDLVIQDFEAVLDRDERTDCFWSWSGYAPAPPTESIIAGNVQVNCGGDLSVPVSVSIGPVGLETTVFVSSPTMVQGGETATAEASVSSAQDGGEITGVTLLTPGSGYAREIFTRSQPGITATVGGSTGTGASLSVTLAQSGSGEFASWSVSSVAVNSGGTGYVDFQSVEFTPEEGATTDYPASAYIVVGRVEPTVTASVSGGSDAVLSVVLAQSTDWNGLTIWYVESVTVVNGGTGYTDGDPVTFAVTDGTASYNASGSISVTDGIITGVNVDWWNVGEYYKSTGVITGVVVLDSGVYYKQTSTGTSAVDVPTVTFSSYSGSGATATATVDGAVGSPTFGQITGITVTNGGQNYRAAGTGWASTISIGTLNHLEVLLGNETPPEPNEDDPVDCANFWNKRLPFANRVSFEPCPADLLEKSHVMSCGAFGLPFGDPYGDGMSAAVWCRTPAPFWGGSPTATFFEFGNGEITCTISAGGDEEEEEEP